MRLIRSRSRARVCSFVDYAALGFGGAAIVTGAIAALKAGSQAEATLNRVVGSLAMLVGIWRTLYGLGVLGGPC